MIRADGRRCCPSSQWVAVSSAVSMSCPVLPKLGRRCPRRLEGHAPAATPKDVDDVRAQADRTCHGSVGNDAAVHEQLAADPHRREDARDG
jgi:hypothetical protein